MLTRDQIKAAKDRPREWLPIPEWTPEGETFDAAKHGVWIASMSARQRDEWESAALARKTGSEAANLDNLRAQTAIAVCQDADGKPLFTQADAAWLGDKDAAPLSAIFDVGTRLSKIRKADQEELVKN